MKWARKVAYDFEFVIIILGSNTANGQRGIKAYVLLGYERGGKYRQYKQDLYLLKVEAGNAIVHLDYDENR